MKSFLEFVPCCGYQEVQPTVQTASPRRDEAQSFPCVRRRRLNRSNSGSSSSSSSSSSHWQPKLGVISEDNVVSVVVRKTEEAPKSGKKVARKTASKAQIRVRTRYGDDFGQSGVPLAIPSFSPTAFLF